MFGTQNMAMPLLPGAQQQLFCPYYYNTGCFYFRSYCYGYPSIICGYYYISWCRYITYITVEQVQACAFSDGPPVGVGPGGDPVEALQALRRQLEVALAGVRAQEEELRRQRAAGGGEGSPQGRGARGGT